MKLLGNSSQGILPIQKQLLYRTCILPIALYGFQLWFFKKAPIYKNIAKLKKMQHRATLWITGAFQTSPLEGIEAIAGLVPIFSHLQKLNGCHYLCYASVPPSHAINSLLDLQHAKDQPPHKFSMSSLTPKQQAKLTSPIKDVNERLSKITKTFHPLHPLLSPGSRVVNRFSSRIASHSPPSSSDEDLFKHIQDLNITFCQSQCLPYHTAVIADGGVKKNNVTTAAAHIWLDNHVVNQPQIQTMNITSVGAELMAIYIGLTPAMAIDDTHNITIITDSIVATKKILESHVNPYQNIALPLIANIKLFLGRDRQNTIHFWYCPSKAEWPRHKLVDDQVKATASTPTLPSKNSFLFSRKKECDNILKEWQVSFSSSQKKDQLFLDFEDEKERVLKPTYVKGGSWLPSIGFSNSLCTRFTHMTTGHAPISEYCQRFFPNSPTSCPCSKVDVQTREHIVMQCDQYKQSTRPCNTVINSFVHFLADNPSAFSFDNG